ncbi:hypothetical protein FDI59_gp047 [Mycobacterium phage Yoshi]|uniref:Uncharacterized protein n=1 Tax=Mycobacterium phage Yoshi TaxID=2920891 RepID=G1BSF4_9CAUD|nr:hypothetical protein FDI59_gp047 [Mycobacterium phage Yoshi]AEK07798.1 hypothetical protein YOSHI_47 [Mycobacterium phage Yoshi]
MAQGAMMTLRTRLSVIRAGSAITGVFIGGLLVHLYGWASAPIAGAWILAFGIAHEAHDAIRAIDRVERVKPEFFEEES